VAIAVRVWHLRQRPPAAQARGGGAARMAADVAASRAWVFAMAALRGERYVR